LPALPNLPRSSRSSKSETRPRSSPERAPGLAPGHARLYLEARTEALLAGRLGTRQHRWSYLADVPLDAKGKAPKLKKQRFLVFADPVAGRPWLVAIVDPTAQLPATPATEQLARTVIAALAAPDAPAGGDRDPRRDVGSRQPRRANRRPSCSSTPRAASRSR
jgi:hypothetical protein